MSSNAQILEEVKKAIGAHGKWKLNLRTAINRGKSEYSVEDIRCDNLCEFGKWLYGPTIDEETKAGKPYEVVKRLHAEFHRCASQVLFYAVNDKKDEAIQLLEGEYTERSDILIKALNKWKGELIAAG